MLGCIRIRNLAIIDELEVELGPGLNVITGETGAGKSILIEALELVLGARARPELVRAGAAQAEVEALFVLGGREEPEDAALRARLAEHGIEVGSELVLRRVVTAQGRSRAYANGTLVTAAQLGALSEGLVDISSQHEHHALAQPAAVLGYLDAFAGHGEHLEAMRSRFSELDAAETALADARAAERGRAEREDLLRFQLAELDALAPRPGEAAELERERERLRHAEKLLAASAAAEEAIYGRDGSISEELAQVGARLASAAALDPTLRGVADLVAAARVQLEDAARELGAYARDVSLDPERLREVDERLHALGRLARKHSLAGEADVTGALAARAEHVRGELEALESGEARALELEARRAGAGDRALEAAVALSRSRAEAAARLSRALGAELRGLGMPAAEVVIALRPMDGRGLAVGDTRVGPAGRDAVELLVATNAGEEARPLRAIGSGGELSRTMLALKRVLAGRASAGERRGIGLFVFDEVDTGVGGAVGEVIGRSLADVARHHAVLCVTHLAPIAAYADRHLVVRKEVAGGRTASRIETLDARERVEELARMLGGLSITKKTRGVAAELLRGARAAA